MEIELLNVIRTGLDRPSRRLVSPRPIARNERLSRSSHPLRGGREGRSELPQWLRCYCGPSYRRELSRQQRLWPLVSARRRLLS